jgi:hypothetical protein
LPQKVPPDIKATTRLLRIKVVDAGLRRGMLSK